MAFVVGSYQAVEHPGSGHRASAAALWRGEDLRTLNEIAMTVLPVECADAARQEVGRVAAIQHPHLLPVIDVVQDADRVAVVCPWPAGGRLAELVLRRGRLTASETLTVLMPLAAALIAAHSAGVGHGGICPETIWFDAHGRPLLGAPAVSRLIASLNDGLPAGIRDVAPEVVRGEKSGGDPDARGSADDSVHGDSPGKGTSARDSPTAAADLFSLGSVALFCLTGRSAWPADDPADVLVMSAAGQWPDPTNTSGPTELIALVREMLRREPGSRPTAADLAVRLERCGDPAPVRFASGPSPTPASTDRWRGWSASPGDERPTAAGVARPAFEDTAGHGRDDGQPGTLGEIDDLDQAPAAERSGPARSARPGAPVNRRNTPLARAGLALLGGLLITVVALQAAAWWSGHDQPDSTAVGVAVGPAVAPAADPIGTGPEVSADAAPAAADPAQGQQEPGDAATAEPGADEPGAAEPGLADGVTLTWSDIVVGLDAARGRALDAADPSLLAAVYLDSTSIAGATDAAVITQLAEQGYRVVDGVHQIVSVTLADPVAAGSGPVNANGATAAGQVRLAVVDTLPSHPVVDAGGRQVGVTPAREEQRRILVLSSTSSGYRISSIEAG